MRTHYLWGCALAALVAAGFGRGALGAGACCFTSGSCQVTSTNIDCIALGGTWMGSGTMCIGSICLGACCLPNNTCQVVSSSFCAVSAGDFFGYATSCAPASQCPGACCHSNGTCTIATNALTCAGVGGTFQGAGTLCSSGLCTGACCLLGGSCSVVGPGNCMSFGAAYLGNGTSCLSATCEGACCFDDGTCTFDAAFACTLAEGAFQGYFTACEPDACPAAGACCLIDGTCQTLTEPACAAAYGDFHGVLSSCSVIVCPVPGAVLDDRKISDTQGGFDGAIGDSYRFGAAVAPIGDLDGDGIGDLAVGASGDDDGPNPHGQVWILFLAADGTVASEQIITEGQGGFGGALDDADEFGTSIAGLGDIDGDGVNDIAVGAPGDDDGSTNRGAVWILFLNANGTVDSHQKIGAFASGLSDLGTSVAALGDLDANGVTDLAVGAPIDVGGGSPGSEHGAVWTIFLNSNGTVASTQKITTGSGGFGDTLESLGQFGSSVAAIDDLDGDGVIDLAVGAINDWGWSSNTLTGAVWVLFLNANGTVHAETKVSDQIGGFGVGLANNDWFGHAVTSPGDLNGDGHADLVVGAPQDNQDSAAAGALWIVFLEPGGTCVGKRKITDNVGGMSAGTLDSTDNFGVSVARIGDIDGDGIQDVAAGAHRDDDGGAGANADRGAVWQLMLAGATDVVFVPITEPGAGPGNHEATGDFDEDGFEDVVIVIPTLDQAQVFLNNGTNFLGEWLGFTALAPIPVGNNPNGVAVGYLDDDAHLDLAVANTNDDDVRVLLGSGTGTFTFDVDVPVGNAPRAVAVANLKGDAQADLAVANTDDDTVTVYRNMTPPSTLGGEDGERSEPGEGSFTGGFTAWQLSITIATGDQPVSLEPEDVDNDKDLDLVIVNKGGGTTTVALLQGGALQSSQTVAVGGGPTDVALGDLDDDGDLDLATANADDGTLTIIPNGTIAAPLGGAIFGAAQTVPVGDEPVSIDMADLDNDGDLDLAVVAEDFLLGPVVQVLENHTDAGGGEILFAPPVSFAIGADPNFVVAVDLDGDGVSDLVTVNTDDTPGGGSVTGLVTYSCTGDINGDGLVGFADVTQLLIAWGPCAPDPAPCPFDIDGNGTVGFADLTLLLLGWGDCS